MELSRQRAHPSPSFGTRSHCHYVDSGVILVIGLGRRSILPQRATPLCLEIREITRRWDKVRKATSTHRHLVPSFVIQGTRAPELIRFPFTSRTTMFQPGLGIRLLSFTRQDRGRPPARGIHALVYKRPKLRTLIPPSNTTSFPLLLYLLTPHHPLFKLQHADARYRLGICKAFPPLVRDCASNLQSFDL